MSLCDGQKKLGRDECLSRIHTPEAAPFTLDDFRRFASIAASSLTHLTLARDHKSVAKTVTFSQLPQLISIIQDDLPCLDMLHMALGGVAEAERICGALLRPDTMEKAGTVKYLEIYTDQHRTPLFNTLRLLSAICKDGAEVEISHDDQVEWSGKKQTALVAFLREQPRETRARLSIADFPSGLDIYTPDQVMAIGYDDDGRPEKRRVTKSSDWVQDTDFLSAVAVHRFIPDLKESVRDCVDAFQNFNDVADDTSTSDVLEQSALLLGSLEEVNKTLGWTRTLQVKMMEMEREIKDFTNMIKDINGIDRSLDDPDYE